MLSITAFEYIICVFLGSFTACNQEIQFVNYRVGYFLFCRKLRRMLVYAAVFWLVSFWFIPVSFVSSLIALNNLAKEFSFLKPGTINNFIRSRC